MNDNNKNKSNAWLSVEMDVRHTNYGDTTNLGLDEINKKEDSLNKKIKERKKYLKTQNYRESIGWVRSGSELEEDSEDLDFYEVDLDSALKEKIKVYQDDFEVDSALNEKIKVYLEGQSNHAYVGRHTHENAIKITVNKCNDIPEVENIRFLQLVTRYTIDQRGDYLVLNNPFLKEIFNSTEYYKLKEYNIKQDVKNSEIDIDPNQLSHLQHLRWAVDCVFKKNLTTEQLEQLAHFKPAADFLGCESPYYDQPGDSRTGSYILERSRKSLIDEPELPGVKILYGYGSTCLCEDTVKFVTFIIDEKTQKALGHVEWSRVARPYIAELIEGSKDEWQLVPWEKVTEKQCQLFDKSTKHTYLCEYQVEDPQIYVQPRDLPEWVINKVLIEDSIGRKFDLRLLTNHQEEQLASNLDLSEAATIINIKSSAKVLTQGKKGPGLFSNISSFKNDLNQEYYQNIIDPDTQQSYHYVIFDKANDNKLIINDELLQKLQPILEGESGCGSKSCIKNTIHRKGDSGAITQLAFNSQESAAKLIALLQNIILEHTQSKTSILNK